MKIHFFERRQQTGQISIEKLFAAIRSELLKRQVDFEIFKNVYSLRQFWRTMIDFKSRQGDINHITGDIHWATLLLDRNKTILTIHDLAGMQTLSGIKKMLYFLFWIYLPVKRLKYLTTISVKTRDEIIRYIPSAKNKIRVIPNCLLVGEATPTIFDKGNAVPKILIVGTRANKNIDTILEAVRSLDIKLLVVGFLTDSHLKILKDNRIDFINYTNIDDNQLISLYDKSDILCFPSKYEGFGLPILEAQARNCVVITSDISPLKEVSGQGAVLVDPESSQQIRKAIVEISNNWALRKQLIIEGKKNLTKYSPSLIAAQYLELYTEILTNNDPG